MRAQLIFIGVRLAAAGSVVLAVTLLVFMLLHVIPGDPVDVMLGEYAAVADREALRARLGLDLSLAQQWWTFASGVARLDLGVSMVSGHPVVDTVLTHFRMTAVLAIAALFVALAFGVPLGVLAALRPGSRWDHLSMIVAVVAMSVPNFVLGPLLILLFSVALGWLPVGGADSPDALILPALTLGLSMAALLARMTRATMLDVLEQPYITAARARGLSEQRVITVHALGNAALPLVTVMGLQLGALLGGAVITEVVFGWPGVGQLLVESIQRRDYPVAQACVLVISFAYVALNTLTDMFYTRIDPRVVEGP